MKKLAAFLRAHSPFLTNSLSLFILAVFVPMTATAAVVAMKFESESGTVTGQASIYSDSNASGGSALQFTAPPTTTNCTSFNGTNNITAGGTYTGCWNSVTVNTSAAVTIQNCGVKATSPSYNLIQVNGGGNVTVKNCYLEGWPTASNNGPRGIFCAGCASLTADHNEFLHIAPLKAGGASNIVLKFTSNKIRDVIGDETNCCGGGFAPAMQMYDATFSQSEIAWNEVINTPGASNQEDTINIYNAGGVSASNPISVHDNFVWGAYPLPITDGYSGGGMLTGDGENPNVGHVRYTNNQIVGTTNYGIQQGGGTDIYFTGNRVVASQTTSSGQQVGGQNTGAVIWDYRAFYCSGAGSGCQGSKNPPTNSHIDNNVFGWMTNGNRNDFWDGGNSQGVPAGYCNSYGNSCNNNTSLKSGNITYADEQAEYTRWQQKLSTNGMKPGRI